MNNTKLRRQKTYGDIIAYEIRQALSQGVSPRILSILFDFSVFISPTINVNHVNH